MELYVAIAAIGLAAALALFLVLTVAYVVRATLKQAREEVERLERVNDEMLRLVKSSQNKAICRDVAAYASLQAVDFPQSDDEPEQEYSSRTVPAHNGRY